MYSERHSSHLPGLYPITPTHFRPCIGIRFNLADYSVAELRDPCHMFFFSISVLSTSDCCFKICIWFRQFLLDFKFQQIEGRHGHSKVLMKLCLIVQQMRQKFGKLSICRSCLPSRMYPKSAFSVVLHERSMNSFIFFIQS